MKRIAVLLALALLASPALAGAEEEAAQQSPEAAAQAEPQGPSPSLAPGVRRPEGRHPVGPLAEVL